MARWCLTVCVICICFAFAPVVAAQDTPSSPSQNSDRQTADPADLDAASAALIRVLRDPAGRDALIDRLQAVGQDVAAGEKTATDGEDGDQIPASADAEGQLPEEESYAVWLGQYTRLVADDVRDTVFRIGRGLNGFVLLGRGEVQVRWERASHAVLEVAVVLSVAFAVYWVAKRQLILFFRKRSKNVRRDSVSIRFLFLALTTLADGVIVFVSSSAGYAAALIEAGMLGSGVSLLESLTLNAFLATGLAKVAVRFVFAPERHEFRLLPLSDVTARYWAGRLGFVVVWIGYGLMLAVPMANITASFLLGNAIRFLVVIMAAGFVLMFVHRNYDRVALDIKQYADTKTSELMKRTLYRLADLWHITAYLYIIMVFGIWISRPFDAAAIIVRSTGFSILAIMAAFALSIMMARAIKEGIRLPDGIRSSLPALEGRLNAFVPRILRILRFLVFIGTVLLLMQIWGIANVAGWARSPAGLDLISRYSSATLVFLTAFIVWLAVMSWVDLRLRVQAGYVVTARVRTLFQLFRNAFTVVILVMALLLALSEIGVDIGPLIAGAGVVGLAISFGAQTLVKDIITGAFIQIENAINEGDVITVAGTTGVVERLTVRSVRLRDLDGTTHIVPFSSVDMVSNFMRDFSYHVAVVGVAYDTDIKKAKTAMEEAFRRLKESPEGESIIGDLEMHGVTNFGESAIDIRARIKTTPGNQWATGRAYNECVKTVFDEQGIEIPFPQVTYHAAVPPGGANLQAG